MRWYYLGVSAVTIEVSTRLALETSTRVFALQRQIEQEQYPWLIECIPAFTTLTLVFDPLCLTLDELEAELQRMTTLPLTIEDQPFRRMSIPVCYEGYCAPDLEEVSQYTGLPAQEVIARHSGVVYTVAMIGFSPGFPYLTGLDPSLEMPRKASPRLKVPAGSVGIGGKQTGIYSLETPGGWNIIGRTAIPLFSPERESPSLLQEGDIVGFEPISLAEFENIVHTVFP